MAFRPPLSVHRTSTAVVNRPWTAYSYPTAAGCWFSSAPSSFIRKRYHHGLRELGWGRFPRDTSATPELLLSSARGSRPVCINVTRKSLLNQIYRSFSILSKPIFDESPRSFRNLYHNRAASRRFHLSTPLRYDRLQNLEDAANRDRDNANAQAVFLQVLPP
jgi:hypothetical protein